MPISRRRKRRARRQPREWPMLGSVLLLTLVYSLLMASLLMSCGLTQVSGDPTGPAMALYTPSSDTFAPLSDTPSKRMPLPFTFQVSPARVTDTFPLTKPGDL